MDNKNCVNIILDYRFRILELSRYFLLIAVDNIAIVQHVAINELARYLFTLENYEVLLFCV